MNEKNGAIRDASVLGVPKMLILGVGKFVCVGHIGKNAGVKICDSCKSA